MVDQKAGVTALAKRLAIMVANLGNVMRALVKLIFVLGTAALLATSGVTAPCRDAKGKFTKCPTTAPAAPARCRDVKGHFTKCGMPGTKPA